MNNMVIKKKKNTSPIIFIFCMVVGACLLCISFKELFDYNEKSNTYVPIDAKVINHTYKNGKVVSVVLEYEVNDLVYTTDSDNSDDCVKSYGSIVDIMYDPDDPESIIFVNREINIAIPIAAIVVLSVGIAIIIVDILEGIRSIKYKLFKSNYVNEQPLKSNKQEDVIDISDVFRKPDPIPVATPPEKPKEVKEEVVVNIPFVNQTPIEKHEPKVQEQMVIQQPVEEKVEQMVTQQPVEEHIEQNKTEESINYIDFISEIKDIGDDIPSFIPNASELNKRKQ